MKLILFSMRVYGGMFPMYFNLAFMQKVNNLQVVRLYAEDYPHAVFYGTFMSSLIISFSLLPLG